MIYIPFVSPIPNPQNLKSSSALLAVVIPDALLEQVLGRLDAPLGPVDGDDPLVASGQGLVNGDGGLGVGADLPDPGATGPDDGSGHVLGDGDLGGLLLAAVIFIASAEHAGASAATAEAAEVTAAALMEGRVQARVARHAGLIVGPHRRDKCGDNLEFTN